MSNSPQDIFGAILMLIVVIGFLVLWLAAGSMTEMPYFILCELLGLESQCD